MYEYSIVSGFARDRVEHDINVHAEDGWRVAHVVVGGDGLPFIVLERERKVSTEQ